MMAYWMAAALCWFGRRRLKHGFCPACYSSPPRPGCSVCDGEHQYGAGLDPAKRDLWQQRWDALVDVLR